MIYPFLSVFDLQVLYAYAKHPLACTEAVCDDYTIIIPLYTDPSYLKNVSFLQSCKKHVIIASISGQSSKMDGFLKQLQADGFKVVTMPNGELDRTSQYYGVVKNAVKQVSTKFLSIIDADSVPAGNIEQAVAVLEREDLDLASVTILPSRTTTFMQKMQDIEYGIAMRSRHFRPWMTSGACCIGKTSAIKEVMDNHSLYFFGGDAEIGIIAKELNQRIGYIDFTVHTIVPASFSKWIKQRIGWFGGTFRLFVVNMDKVATSPLLLFYIVGLVLLMVPFKFFGVYEDWLVLPLLYLLYIPITFASNWQARSRWMFVFPLYGAFQSLCFPIAGIGSYLQQYIKYKKIGRIRVRHKRSMN